jgi:hypothetical protein
VQSSAQALLPRRTQFAVPHASDTCTSALSPQSHLCTALRRCQLDFARLLQKHKLDNPEFMDSDDEGSEDDDDMYDGDSDKPGPSSKGATPRDGRSPARSPARSPPPRASPAPNGTAEPARRKSPPVSRSVSPQVQRGAQRSQSPPARRQSPSASGAADGKRQRPADMAARCGAAKRQQLAPSGATLVHGVDVPFTRVFVCASDAKDAALVSLHE